MDALMYLKETVLQPSGSTEQYVDGVFDFHNVYDENDSNIIVGIETIEGKEELKQQALFAALKQRGSDPLALSDGVQWAEAVIGEVSTSVIMGQIASEVSFVSSACTVIFTSTEIETLAFYIEVSI